VKIGITMFPTDYSIGPVELGRAAEDLGFESLFFPEHTHIPTSRRSPWPGGPNLPQEYSHTLDPFAALGAVAATTSRLKIGTGVCLVVERDPITTAKEVATVDLISNGRFLFGIGGGWNEEEMEDHGTDPAHRFKLMRERVLAMKQLWTEDEAEYHGDLVSFDGTWAWPKPVQKPHPPILIGGDGEHVLKRVVAYGDGWMPIHGRGAVPPWERFKTLQEMASEAGRGALSGSVFGTPPKRETIERYQAAGFERCVLGVPPVPAEEALPILKRHAELASSFQN
jgi:probable F420-dependent oxidoreductase